MNNLLAWIVVGAAGIGGIALYVVQMLGRSNEAEGIGETSADEDGAIVAATSAATTAAAMASVDTSSSSSSSIV
jgi:hypothetical protein